ncbi:MAG: hypothetical protein ABIO39_06030 [Caulobacteraceae bacterium]
MSSPTEDLARELWYAYVVRHQQVLSLPMLEWEDLSDFDRQTWIMLARLSMSFWTDPRPRH